MATESCIGGYREILDNILKEYLLPLSPPTVKKSKVIHDALWGSRLFYPWEIALIDTPLMQRLRQISQLGTAFLTYPSAVHNRFSHSLGVAILAGRLIVRLREKAQVDYELSFDIEERDIYTVRLAGLLHDVGHCFFSHCSEPLMHEFTHEVFKEIKLRDGFTHEPKPHELVSYLILTSDHFSEYWKAFIEPYYFKGKDAPEPAEIAKLVVGIKPSADRRYLQEIISGPFDVDKLEYLYRDANMAGLSISYDIERFFYKALLARREGGLRLVMEEGGARAVEQLIFSKMMLNSFVYHHHKILASDAIVLDMLEELLDNGANGGLEVSHPLHFLRYTEFDLFSSAIKTPSERFEKLRDNIKARRLPKRCFSMNHEFIKDQAGDNEAKLNWDRFKEDMKKRKERRGIRKQIVAVIKNKNPETSVSLDSINLNIPRPPRMEESVRAPILKNNGELVGMGQFQQIEGWEATYELKKYRAYFFAEEGLVHKAAEAVRLVLKQNYGLVFEEDAHQEAKITA